MIDWAGTLCLLAQEQGKQQPGSPFAQILIPLIPIGVLWYFLLIRPQRKEQRKRDDLVKALKKNDRVVTVGGILGTVANVSQEGKEVTLKVDDNTRIRLLRTSIQSVITDEDAGGSSK